MSRLPCIEEVESHYKKKEIPLFAVGDTISVQTRIVEENKERFQMFTGLVIAKKGTGLSETFTVYRNAYGSSMERVFLLHSPRIAKIQVVRSGKARRAKLYYLRGKAGKATKLREQYRAIAEGENAPPAAPEEQAPAVPT